MGAITTNLVDFICNTETLLSKIEYYKNYLLFCGFEGFSHNPYRRSDIFIYYSVFLKDFRRWLIILLVSNRISRHFPLTQLQCKVWRMRFPSQMKIRRVEGKADFPHSTC